MVEINLAGIGIALIFIGFLLVIIGSLSGKDVKVGIVGFIEPFAFGWANDPEMGKWIIALSIIMAVIFILFALRGVKIA